MSTRRRTDEIDLEADLELKSIYFVEVSSRRWNSTPGEPEVPPEDTVQQLQVLQSVDDRKVSVRGRMTVKTPQALLVADVVAVYEVGLEAEAPRSAVKDGWNDVELSDDALRVFTERVGVPTIFPFLREAIHSGARKIGAKTPVLGILRRGSVELSPVDDSSAHP